MEPVRENEGVEPPGNTDVVADSFGAAHAPFLVQILRLVTGLYI